MKCSDLQFNLSLYTDGMLDENSAALAAEHLDNCPLCRQALADIHEMLSGLRQMHRPQISAVLQNAIKESIRSEMYEGQKASPPISSSIGEWLQMRLVPYGVGLFASIFVGLTFLTLMFSGAGPFAAPSATSESSAMLASNRPPYKRLGPDDISQVDYSHSRLDFAYESPSINPQGALIALTKSLVRGRMKDDEVVVVADVFGNGLAQISEVVEPSQNIHAVAELERALDSDPSYAPFVPAAMENRPDSVRVVLKFQNVNVNTGSSRDRHRN